MGVKRPAADEVASAPAASAPKRGRRSAKARAAPDLGVGGLVRDRETEEEAPQPPACPTELPVVGSGGCAPPDERRAASAASAEAAADPDELHGRMLDCREAALRTALAVPSAAAAFREVQRALAVTPVADFPVLHGDVRKLLTSLCPGGGCAAFDPRPAAVAECLKLVRAEAPHHAASVLLAVRQAWPAASWQAIYSEVREQAGRGGGQGAPWTPISVADDPRERALRLTDLYVLALAVSVLRQPKVGRFSRRVLWASGLVVEARDLDTAFCAHQDFTVDVKRASYTSFADNPAAGHLWGVFNLGLTYDCKDFLAVTDDSRRKLGDALVRVFEEHPRAPGGSDGIAAAARGSMAAVRVDEFVRELRFDMERSARPFALREAVEALLWPDLAKLLLLLIKRRYCALTFLPLQLLPPPRTDGVARDVRAGFWEVLPDLTDCPAIVAHRSKVLKKAMAEDAQSVRRTLVADRGSGTGAAVRPEWLAEYAATAYSPFADDSVRAVLRRTDPGGTAGTVDAADFPAFKVRVVHAFGEVLRLPVLPADGESGSAYRRSAAFLSDHARFIALHRPGILLP